MLYLKFVDERVLLMLSTAHDTMKPAASPHLSQTMAHGHLEPTHATQEHLQAQRRTET
jgi:hypothetical protein